MSLGAGTTRHNCRSAAAFQGLGTLATGLPRLTFYAISTLLSAALRSKLLPARQHVQQPKVARRFARVCDALAHLEQLSQPLNLQAGHETKSSGVRKQQGRPKTAASTLKTASPRQEPLAPKHWTAAEPHLCQQLQPAREHGVDAADAAKVQLSVQLCLAHAEAQQIACRHVPLHNLQRRWERVGELAHVHRRHKCLVLS